MYVEGLIDKAIFRVAFSAFSFSIEASTLPTCVSTPLPTNDTDDLPMCVLYPFQPDGREAESDGRGFSFSAEIKGKYAYEEQKTYWRLCFSL